MAEKHQSTKQYPEKCVVCGMHYIATRTGSSCCSNRCRARKSKGLSSMRSQRKIFALEQEKADATITKVAGPAGQEDPDFENMSPEKKSLNIDLKNLRNELKTPRAGT